MKLALPRSCAFLASALVLLSAPLSAADDPELGVAAGTVLVPEGKSATEVQDAIVHALLGRQWEVKQKGSDRVVGYLKHRTNEATLTLIYSTTKVELFCVGWQIDKKTGRREKPEQPKGWLNNIRTDLGKILNRPASSR